MIQNFGGNTIIYQEETQESMVVFKTDIAFLALINSFR